MSMLKKVSIISLSFFLLLSMLGFSSVSFAKNADGVTVLYKAKEIKNVDKLLKRAKKEISDDNSLKNGFLNKEAKLKGSKSSEYIQVYNTTQLLKKVKTNND